VSIRMLPVISFRRRKEMLPGVESLKEI